MTPIFSLITLFGVKISQINNHGFEINKKSTSWELPVSHTFSHYSNRPTVYKKLGENYTLVLSVLNSPRTRIHRFVLLVEGISFPMALNLCFLETQTCLFNRI